MTLTHLFNPRSVAVIGASSDPSKVGYALLKNLVEGDVARTVYPVTLNATELFGRHAYRSVHDLPGHVDLAVIAVRADMVPTVLRECAGHGVTSAIVISAGFKEVGQAGRVFEDECATIAREHAISLLGPNCLGLINTRTNLNASFAVGAPLRGDIAFLSQSGALGTALMDHAKEEGIGFSSFVSLGNEAVLTESDFLEHVATDESHAVLLYLEQVANGARFLEAARRVTSQKPLVVLRAGRSERGGSAVSSHTGALAPSDAVFSEALREAGAYEIDSVGEFFAVTKLLQQRITKGITNGITKLCVLTNGGGPSINTADLIERSDHLSLAVFSDTTTTALREVLPPVAAVGNPVDVIGDADAMRYERALAVLTDLTDVDAIMMLVTPQMMTKSEEIAEVLITASERKFIVPVFMGGAAVLPGVERLRRAGLTPFSVPSDAVRALDILARYEQGKPHTRGNQNGAPETLMMMGIEDMTTLLGEYGLTLEGVFVREGGELPHALTTLGEGPYAIKAISRELVHKSDLRAVQLGLVDQAGIERAWGEIYEYVQAHTPGATIDGMLIQRMRRGVEVIIGMKRDHVFGPVILVGLGGIFVEILKDSALGIAPVTKEDAFAQVLRLKGLPLLTGARGREKVNLDALAHIIASLSTLALEHPKVREIDFNPVFATPEGAHIVDARVMV